MNGQLGGRFIPSAMLLAALFGGAAGCSAQPVAETPVSVSPASEAPVPLTLQCETPDAGLLAAMTGVAAAATLPGSTIKLINPSAVDAGGVRQAFAFSWIAQVGDISQSGPSKTYVGNVGDDDPSTWQEIPYDTAIVDPYGKHPELSVDDETALLAAHAALGCTMGG